MRSSFQRMISFLGMTGSSGELAGMETSDHSAFEVSISRYLSATFTPPVFN